MAGPPDFLILWIILDYFGYIDFNRSELIIIRKNPYYGLEKNKKIRNNP